MCYHALYISNIGARKVLEKNKQLGLFRVTSVTQSYLASTTTTQIILFCICKRSNLNTQYKKRKKKKGKPATRSSYALTIEDVA